MRTSRSLRARRRALRARKRNTQRKKRDIETLEPRVLLSATSPGLGKLLSESGIFGPGEPNPPAWALEAMQAPAREPVAEIDPASLSTQQIVRAAAPRQVVFVDEGIEDYQQLIRALDLEQDAPLAGQIDVVLLTSDADGIAQITDYLRATGNVGGVHILSHGSAGSLQLGSARLDNETLGDYADQLGEWRNSLADHADILLYGCNVAEGEWGISFVEEFSAATGADIAASTDLTGARHLGGDWRLEYATGAIESRSVVDVDMAQKFQHALVTDVPATDITTASTFTITGPNIKVADKVGGQNEQNTALGDLADTIKIKGLGFANNYFFNELPNLGDNLAGSLLDGGDVTMGTVNFSGFGTNNDDLTFEIRATKNVGAANGTAGITARQTSGNSPIVFQNIFRVGGLVGGKADNTFKFFNTWDANLLVNGRISDQDGDANLPVFHGTLDFAQYSQNLVAAVTRDGKIAVTAAGNNNNNPVVTAEGIEKVSSAAAKTMSLDLSDIETDLTITVERISTGNASTTGSNTKVTIQAAAGANDNPKRIPTIVFERVSELTLGSKHNELIFGKSAVLPSIVPGDQATTTLELDYSKFGSTAKVNHGPAVPNLNDTMANNAAGVSTLTEEAANTWAWGQATYQVTAIDTTGDASFTFGDSNSLLSNVHKTIDLAAAAGVGAGLKSLFEGLEGVVGDVDSQSLASPWTVTVKSNSTNFMAAGTAQGGANASITLAAADARDDEAYAGKKITITSGPGAGESKDIIAYNPQTKVASVVTNWTNNPTGASTYVITDGDELFPVLGSPNSVATYALGGGGRVLTLASNATHGTFKLKFFDNTDPQMQDVVMQDILLDRARHNANEIRDKLVAAVPGVATVTGHGTDADPWVIRLAGTHTFQSLPIDTANLNGAARVRIEQTAAPTPTVMPRWNLQNNVDSGHFTLTYRDGVQRHTYTTRPLPYNASPELIQQALLIASDNDLIVRVTPRQVQNVANAWTIEAVHKDFSLTQANRGNVELEVMDAGGNMLANSAAGIGSIAGTANKIGNIKITKIKGSGRADDFFYFPGQNGEAVDVTAGAGHTTLFVGNSGDDTVTGAHATIASGGGGDDTLSGGAGNQNHKDILLGGDGSDELRARR